MWRSLGPVIVCVLAITLVPLLILGFAFEERVGAFIHETIEPLPFALTTIGVLAGDVFLPVPSSLINTLAGSRLGIVLGTLVAWCGMNLGAIVAFALARTLGQRGIERLTQADDRVQLAEFAEQRGEWLLVATRALPVLAEATVLLVGALGLSWRRFLYPTLLANLGLAVAYATLGKLAYEHNLLSIALPASVALPLLATWLVRRHWK